MTLGFLHECKILCVQLAQQQAVPRLPATPASGHGQLAAQRSHLWSWLAADFKVGHSHHSLFHCLWVTHTAAFFIVCGSLTPQPFSLSPCLWVIHTAAFFIVCGSLTPQPFSSSVGHSHRSLFHCLWVTHATAFFIVCGSLTLQPFSLSVIGCSGSVDWKVSVSARKKKMDDGKFCKLSVSMMGKLSHREKEREKLIFLRTVYCRVTRICTPDLDLRPLDCDRLHADPVALIFDVTCLQ